MTSGYVSAPQCVPSRAGLLSGRYQNRLGVESNGHPLDGLQIAVDIQFWIFQRCNQQGAVHERDGVLLGQFGQAADRLLHVEIGGHSPKLARALVQFVGIAFQLERALNEYTRTGAGILTK